MFSLSNLFSKSKTKTKKAKSSSKSNSNKAKDNKTKKSSNTNSVKELCSKKYKDKAVRGTPKNWAYNRCIKKNSWERCKNLPPQGWGMHRYFCE
jgi:hypothetical protein